MKFWSSRRVDAALALSIGVMGAFAGIKYVTVPAVAASAQYYQEALLPPSVLFACGRGCQTRPFWVTRRSRPAALSPRF